MIVPAQRTLVLLKPDAVQRGLVGEVLQRFERKALRIVGMKFLTANNDIAGKHYAEHKERPFFPSLLSFITSSPLAALVLEGDDAIAVVRGLIGPTDGRKAPPGTIRGDFALSKSNNLVHASDSPESAARELAIWFPEGLVSWKRCDTVWAESE
jgi:nucleoside-diphosphate kinase